MKGSAARLGQAKAPARRMRMADDLLDQRQAQLGSDYRHHEPWKPGASATVVRAKTGCTRPTGCTGFGRRRNRLHGVYILNGHL